MADFNLPLDWEQQEWWENFGTFQPMATILSCNTASFDIDAHFLSSVDNKGTSTPSSLATGSENSSEESLAVQCNSRKRRQASESSSDALVRSRKTRKLKAPDRTAKVREKGACFFCQKRRKEVS